MTEPGAGSDLANIHADLILLACKTDPKAQPAHKSISLLLEE
jgi:acyl-CoA dehydrogenase